MGRDESDRTVVRLQVRFARAEGGRFADRLPGREDPTTRIWRGRVTWKSADFELEIRGTAAEVSEKIRALEGKGGLVQMLSSSA